LALAAVAVAMVVVSPAFVPGHTSLGSIIGTAAQQDGSDALRAFVAERWRVLECLRDGGLNFQGSQFLFRASDLIRCCLDRLSAVYRYARFRARDAVSDGLSFEHDR